MRVLKFSSLSIHTTALGKKLVFAPALAYIGSTYYIVEDFVEDLTSFFDESEGTSVL